MNRLSIEKRASILGMLVEGVSLRSASRLADVSINTVSKLWVDIGAASGDYQNEVLRNLRCNRIQCDEIWAFVYAKDKNVPVEKQEQFGYGSVWTWVALDPDSKLVISHLVGVRSAEWANAFMADIAHRLATKVQLTTDGHRVYLDAVEGAFGIDVDYAQLVKLYGESTETEKRYSPGECIGCKRYRVTGPPDPSHISTSLVERQHLTMRMSMRRFTRLTNAFSKKVGNRAAAVAIHFMHYNFARIHKALRVTPAMEAGVSNHVWSLEEIADLAN